MFSLTRSTRGAGILNALSQSARTRTSEIMITMTGRAFARRLLKELHTDEFEVPRFCGDCDVQRVICREKDGRWYWKCLRCNDKEYLARR